MSSRRRTALHVLFAFVVIGATVAMNWVPGSVGAQLDGGNGNDNTVSLTGNGEDLQVLTDGWESMFGTNSPIDLSFIPQGTKAGRASFASGGDDFVLSGRPLSSSDQAALTTRGTSAITAPIAVSALTFLMGTSDGLPLTTISVDPAVEDVLSTPCAATDPPTKVCFRPVTSAPQLPPNYLARVFLGGASNLYNDADAAKVFAPNFTNFGRAKPGRIVRSDPDSQNYYLWSFLQQTAGSELTAKGVTGAPDEEWPPVLATPSKQGEAQILNQLATRREPTIVSADERDLYVGVSPVGAAKAIADAARPGVAYKATYYQLPVKNGRGEWVLPTPDAISKAAAGAVAASATDPKPLWGLTDTSDAAAGAYPLTWVVNMSVQSSGLSVVKTNALAMLVRLFSSDAGQNMAKLLGDGTLPPALAADARSAADRIVTSNCVGSDRKVTTVSSGGGPYWPSGVPAPTGSIQVCTAVAAPATTTTASPTVGSSGGSTTGFSATGGASSSGSSSRSGSTSAGARNTVGYSGSSSSGSTGSDETSVLGTSTESAAGSTSGATSASGNRGAAATAQTASAALPMPLPDDGRKTLDRLTTMILGGLAFLFVRGAMRRRQVGA